MIARPETHIDPTQIRDRIELALPIVGDGPVVMLNMLRFRAVADYSESPELAPESPISGEEAYARYMAAAEPRSKTRGNEILLSGKSGPFLIGPEGERWDMILLVRWPNLKMLAASGSDKEYLAFVGHRTAAIEDSRLLPILQST